MKNNYLFKHFCTIIFLLGINYTTLAQCNSPSGLLAANISNNSVDLIWNEQLDANQYELRYRSFNSSQWISLKVADNIYSLTGLLSGNSYYWKVSAICGTVDNSVQSDFSSTFSFTTAGSPSCPAPINLNFSNPTSSSADITWSSGVEAESYEIKYRETTSSQFSSLNSSINSATLTGLKSGTQYVWIVRAICSSENFNISAYSTSSFFQTSGSSACPAPQNLSTQNISNNSVMLSWSAVAESNGEYLLKYRVASSTSFSYKTIVGTSVVLDNLAEGTDYIWLLQTICNDQGFKSVYSSVESFTTSGPVACIAPTGLSTQNITDVSARVSWNANPGDVEYVLRYRSLTTPIFTEVITTSNTFTITNLNAEQNYVWIVKRVCTPDRKVISKYSDAIQFATKAQCAVPTLLTVNSIADNSATLDWEDANNGLQYNLRYRRVNATTWNNVNSNESTYNLTNLFSGTSYEWQVRTICSNETTAYSSIKTFKTTGEPACPAPTNLSVSNITNSSAQLNWASANGALEYEVRYRNINGSSYSSFTTTGTSAVLNSLIPGNTYIWEVRNVCSSISSPYSGLVTFNTTGQSPCAPPSNLVTSNIDNNSADISWGIVSGALSYEVRYRVSTESGYTKVATENNSLTIPGLFTGTEYIWKVRTICTDGLISSDSELNYFTTSGITSCAVPAVPFSFNVGDTGVDLTWNTVEGALSYEVKYRPITSPQFTYVTSSVNFLSLSGLNRGSNYVWMVRAICSNDNSLASFFTEPAYFETTGEKTCTAPVGLFVNNITTTSATLNWGESNISGEYEIKYRPITNPQFTYVRSNTNSFVLSSLQPNTTYVFLVKSICGDGNSSTLSDPKQFSTLPAAEPTVFDNTGDSESFTVSSINNGLEIEFENESDAKSLITVYNIFGEKIADFNNVLATDQNIEIPISHTYHNKILVVRVTSNGKSVSKKIIIL